MHHPSVSLLITVLVAVICTFRMTKCSLPTTTTAKSSVAASCVIPNELQRGVCVSAGDCPAFQRINDIAGLSSIGRVSFLRELHCDIDAEQSGICCPKNSIVGYRQPWMNETLERRDRTTFATRFGNEAYQCGEPSEVIKVKAGHITAIDEFPWMAMLLYGNSEAPGCGGALISSSFVITAAHCLVGKNVQDRGNLKYVRLGEYDFNSDPDCMLVDGSYKDCTEGKQDFKPKRAIPHPEYSPSEQSQHHDLGLIQLERSVVFSDFIRPICLPPTPNQVPTSPGTKYNVCGWGRTNFFRGRLGEDALSPIKLKTVLPYFDHQNCREIYRAQKLNLGSGQLCAGGRKADTCAGDSGSPLMFYDRKQSAWLLTGVVSLGVQSCGTEGKPGIYTNVAQYAAWVKKTANL